MAFLPWLIKSKTIQTKMDYKVMKNIRTIALVIPSVFLIFYSMIGTIMGPVANSIENL